MIDGVQVINTVKLISAAIPGYWDNGNYCNYDYNTSWDKMTEFVKKYVDEKDIYYYSEEKQFFLSRAAEEAKEKGAKICIAENLS